jgi:hypothetical protein
MKKVILGLALILSSNAWSFSFADLAGVYSASPAQNVGMKIENILTVYANGDIELTERSPYGQLNCQGQASWQGTTIVSALDCENGASFTQEVKLGNVNNFDNFEALVYSSLYEMELLMRFKKIK